jgi:hypothetical protein
MTPLQEIVNATGRAGEAAGFLFAEGAKFAVESPEKVMEEIWSRATQVGSVLENILHEAECQHWEFEH